MKCSKNRVLRGAFHGVLCVAVSLTVALGFLPVSAFAGAREAWAEETPTYTVQDFYISGLYSDATYDRTSLQKPADGNIVITKAGGSLAIRLYQKLTDASGAVVYGAGQEKLKSAAETTEKWLGIENLTYTSAAPELISVDENGIVTAHANVLPSAGAGVRITVSGMLGGNAVSASVDVYATNQSTAYSAKISVEGLYKVDMYGNILSSTKQSTEAPIVSPNEGQLRIRLYQVIESSDDSLSSNCKQFTSGWLALDEVTYTSDKPEVISVDAYGILTAHTEDTTGVVIRIRGTFQGISVNTQVRVYASDTPVTPVEEPDPDPENPDDSDEPGTDPDPEDPDDPDVFEPEVIVSIPSEVTNAEVSAIAVYALYNIDGYGQMKAGDGNVHYPGSDITISEQGGKLQIVLTEVLRASGATHKNQGLDDDWVGVNPRYISSNPDYIAVDNLGVVTAKKTTPGPVTIHILGDGGLYTSVQVQAINQDNAEAVAIVILDEDGNEVETYGTTFDDNTQSKFIHFYARATFVDGSTRSTLPGEEDYDGDFPEEEQRLSNGRLTWLVNNEDVGGINASSGNFWAEDDGMVKVIARCGSASDGVWVQINTGKYSDDHCASDTLTIKIVYSQDESKVFVEETFTVDEVKEWGLHKYMYTLTQSEGRYVTEVGEGVLLSDICTRFGCVIDEITGFRLVANDGANPGFLSRSMLLDQKRYFFPNYDIGCSFQEAEVVPTMLAIADNWTPNDMVDPDDELNSGTCFRLIFGSVGRSDGLTNKSLKYINTLIIVMTGAPEEGFGEGETDGEGTEVDPQTEIGDQPSEQTDEETEEQTEGGKKWAVFQMMAKQESSIPAPDITEQFTPIVVTAVIVLFLFGIMKTVGGFRRQVKRERRAS